MWALGLALIGLAFIVGVIYGSLTDEERYATTRGAVRFLFWSCVVALGVGVMAWLGYMEGL
jgi:hypothetical protein